MMSNFIPKGDFEKADRLRLVRKGVLFGRPLTGPMEVGIIPTYACNYKCIFCALEHESGGLKKSFPFEKAGALIEDLAGINTMQVSLTGGGDPLCYSHVDDLVVMIRENAMACSICTNGALLKKDRIEKWAELDVHLSISFNAAEKTSYEKIHKGTPKDDFGKILSNLELFASKVKRNYSGDGFLSMNFVICNANSNQAPDMAGLAREIGARQVQFRMLQPRHVHKELALDDDELARVKDDVCELSETYSDDPSFIIQAPWALIENIKKCNEEENPVLCLEGFIASYIDSDGVVFPCCLRSDDIENHYMGDINQRPFSQIWQGKKYQEFRKATRFLKAGVFNSDKTNCLFCPKAKHFQYLVDEAAPGNFIPLYEKAVGNLEKEKQKYKSFALGPLPKSGCEVSYDVRVAPVEGKTGETILTMIRVTNKGDRIWPSWRTDSKNPVGLGYHLLDKKSRCVRFDNNPRPYLEKDLLPGQSTSLAVQVKLPQKPGRYFIEFDLVQERAAWFSEKGGKTHRHPIKVE